MVFISYKAITLNDKTNKLWWLTKVN